MTRKPLKFAGVTLIELLCVIAILGILASLLLGSVSRAYNSARNKMWRMESDELQNYIQQRLVQYYKAQTTYPALTVNQLYQQSVFDDRIMDFLRCTHVQYIPFSSADPTNKSVFTMDPYWLNEQKTPPNHTNETFLVKLQVTKVR